MLLVSIFLTSVVVVGGIFYWKNKPFERPQPAGPPAPPANRQQQAGGEATSHEPIRLLATGDMIAHDSINKNAKKADGSYDYAALMADMKPYFDKGDINFCNQSTPAGGESFGISGYPIFNAPVAFAHGINEIGCNLVNIGTNHTFDKGKGLVDATVKAWDGRSILAVAGANRSQEEQDKARIFEVKGVKFGFVAYTDYTNEPLTNDFSVNRYSDALAKKQIQAVREQVDVVIVSMRWGAEYSPEVNTRQDTVAQNLANFGADVIFGHGPHVLQPVKKIKGSSGRDVYVWYSLGNFLNSQLEPETLFGGFASMKIDPASKKITEVGFMPVYQHYEWTPAEKAAANLMARRDFKMVPLDQAEALLSKPNAHLDTTIAVQTDRIKKLLNTFTEIKIISSGDF